MEVLGGGGRSLPTGFEACCRIKSRRRTCDKGKDKTSKDVDLHLYRSMIGSLMYLTVSRPDIMFDVCACARHQVTPKEYHLHAVKRIFRYLKGHPKLGLWHPKESPFDLVAYSDSDYGGATQDWKSTTRGCQCLGRRLISWQCKKQKIMATSTTEAKCVAAASGCGQVLCIQNQLIDYGHHFIRDCFKKKLISVDHIHIADNVADLLTKPFDAGRFQYLVSTARIETTDEGTKILATVDGKLRTISESSIRRNLKVKDEEGISTLPNAKLFENLALMGFNEFSSNIATDVTSALPHDSTPRVTSLAADEGSMQHQLNELTDLYTHMQRQQTEMATKVVVQDLEISNLKARIKFLEDKDGERAEPSGEDAQSRGGVWRQERKHVVQVVNVPLAIEVSTVGIPTGSGMVPTASPIFTTGSVVTPYSRLKGKEKMVESDTPKKKKLQKHIDVQVAREIEEQMYQAQQSKPLSKKQQREFYMSVLKSHSGWKTKHFKGMPSEQIKEKFILVWKQIKDFVPMASKEERERFKRKGLRLEHESLKKIKTLEEVSQEDLKEMMQLVPVEKVYVEALQVKHIIIDWEIHSKGHRNYWKIIRLGGSTVVYQFFVDMLKHFDREDLIWLWTLVKETLSIRQATSDKEKELWVELKRLFEPDIKDQLWTHTQALMHDPVEWRLCDACGVHHMLTGDQKNFMLVEKDYPLRKGLAIVMISNKL
nr:putative ribonuclease H-like domain-containing protein [Tanacetum cinerariifolium]